MRKFLPLAFAGALLAGCAGNAPTLPTTPTPATTTAVPAPAPQTGVIAETMTKLTADITEADQDAKNQKQEGPNGDELSSACYEQGLLPFLQQSGITLPGQNTYKPIGPVGVAQAARDVLKESLALKNGLSPAQRLMLAKACGPLLLDASADVTDLNSILIKLGIGVAGVSTGGITSLIP